jgi:hypothetical protein
LRYAGNVEEAITAARYAFDSGTWPHQPRLRAEILYEFAERLQARMQEIEPWHHQLNGTLCFYLIFLNRPARNRDMQSFRHALRDQLRAVNCPNEVSKAIGGWSEGNDVSSSYGLGYELEVKREWVKIT